MAEKLTIAEAMRALWEEDALGTEGSISHPSFDELLAYHESRLRGKGVESIEEHFVHCRACAVRSAELGRFLAPPEELQKRKPPRLLAMVHRFLQPQILKPLAAALLAATVVSTGAWLASQREVSRLEEGEVNVPVVAIDKAVRRGIEQGKEPQPVEVPRGAILVLTPLRDPRDSAHQVVLSDADGETVWSGEGLLPTNGSFLIRLPRDLEPGRIYSIRITPGEGQDFTIRVAEPGPE